MQFNHQHFTAHISYRILNLEMQLSLQPDQSLKPAAYRWFAQQICAVYADIELDIITVDCHLTQLFASENILKIHEIYDLAHYTVLVALDSVGHEAGIHDCQHVIME